MLPMGNWAYGKVASANCMVSRTTGAVDTCFLYWLSPRRIICAFGAIKCGITQNHDQSSNPELALIPS